MLNMKSKSSLKQNSIYSISRTDRINSQRINTKAMSTSESRYSMAKDTPTALTSRYKRNKSRRLQPLSMSVNQSPQTLTDTIKAIK